MGGRGTSSGSGVRLSAQAKRILKIDTKYSASEIKLMPRSMLELVARAIYIKQNVVKGLSVQEANRRIVALNAGSSDASLRKYIRKYG